MGMSKRSIPTLATSILRQDKFIRITETNILGLHIGIDMNSDDIHKEVFDKLWNNKSFLGDSPHIAEWKKMTVDQLKALLRRNRLPVSGNKKELIERLYDNENLVRNGRRKSGGAWIPKTEQARRRAELHAKRERAKKNFQYLYEIFWGVGILIFIIFVMLIVA